MKKSSRLRQSLGKVKRRFRNFLAGPIFRAILRPNPPATGQGRRRVAIVYLIPNLGDCIMVFPLLDALRREQPEIEISCFTYAGGQILGSHPAIDQHYNLSRQAVDRFRKMGELRQVIAIWLWWNKTFRKLRFDKCVLLRGGVDPFASAHLAWLLGGRERIGYSAAVEPEMKLCELGQDGMLTCPIADLDSIHEIERGCRVLDAAGLVTKPVEVCRSVVSVAALADVSREQNLIQRFPELLSEYRIVAPGNSAEFRRWPCERFASVANRVSSQRGFLTVVIGAGDESELCDRLAQMIDGPVLNLAGQTEIQDLVVLCKNARMFLGNDSGPAHISGACGVPTVILSAFARSGRKTHHNSPWRSHPAGPFVAVVQPEQQLSPCCGRCESDVPHCILQISENDVVKEIESLLTKAGRPLPALRDK